MVCKQGFCERDAVNARLDQLQERPITGAGKATGACGITAEVNHVPAALRAKTLPAVRKKARELHISYPRS